MKTSNFTRGLISLALVALFLVHPDSAPAWGNEGHTYINRVAAQNIPADMPRFLRRAIAEIAYLGPEPDRWRSPSEFALKNAQEADHFIDLERVDGLNPLPPGRYEFYRKLYEKRAATADHGDDYLPEHVGLQPYITIEIFGRLKAAFREYRHLQETHQPTGPVEHAIVFYAGWLGHYVADGSQPLHTTIQYNGWVGPNPNGYTTQHGIHALFETTYVAQNITAADFSKLVHSPERLTDPFQQYVSYLRESNRQVERVYSLEKTGAFTGKGTTEAFTFTTQRLAAGAQMLLNLWYTAWLDSAIKLDETKKSESAQKYQSAPKNDGLTKPDASNLPPPAHLTAEEDHQRLLNLLHITSLRRGPDGDPKSPNAANVDESKVRPYILPDPLTLKNGQKVRTAEMWWKQRRPEIVEDFDREIYGRVPKNTPKVNWEVAATTQEKNGDVPVITKTLVGHVDNSSYPLIQVDIQLTLTTPANAAGPVPVMMEFGLSPEALAAIKKRFTEAQWAVFMGSGPTWQQQVLAKGWGYAVLIPTSVQADNGAGLTEGIIGLVNKGRPRKLDDWGALRAWAWGASRALDYFETDKSVDAKQVGIEGLSRYGKAALVAMAYEPRLAIAFVASSGEGGAKIMRREFGEQVENIASTSEYHWMAGNFLKYAGPLTPDDLPVDAHELIALCAPRAVFISSGSLQVEGGWVDGKGMFLGAVGAGPVYKLLGKKDLGTTEFPAMETALIDGDIAFREHSGGHTAGPNWPTFLTFASRYIETK
ncbi:MAG TPA: hypothetical protein VIW68_14550 [Candidatus Sulfotelmatobacter sp.]